MALRRRAVGGSDAKLDRAVEEEEKLREGDVGEGVRGREGSVLPVRAIRFGLLVVLVVALGAVTLWAKMQQAGADSSVDPKLWGSLPMRSDIGTGGSVIVVGGGLAGLSATLTALNNGASHVTLIDKNPFLGGNSAKATSGINGVNFDEADSPSSFLEETMKAGHNINDQTLVKLVGSESRGAVVWLREKFGLELTDPVRLGGHSYRRTWRFPPTADGKPRPVGWTIISTLKEELGLPKYEDRLSIRLQAKVVNLLTNQEEVVNGVEITSQEKGPEILMADAVILATGGYCAGGEVLETYAKHQSHFPTTNGGWATGDGINLGLSVGADARDMEHVQVHPTSFLNRAMPFAGTNFLAPEALRGVGGIIVNEKGQRFINELAPRDVVTAAMVESGMALTTSSIGAMPVFRDAKTECDTSNAGEESCTRRVAFLIMSHEMIEQFGLGSAAFYASKGLFLRFESAAKAAEEIGLPVEELQKVLAKYSSFAGTTGPDAFGKEYFPFADTLLSTKEFWVAPITPALHYSMGGLRLSASAEILGRESDKNATYKPIVGLFGAGEVTGGMHGANRLAGNSLLECVVMGRIAGSRATSLTLSDKVPPLRKNAWTTSKIRSVSPVDETGYTLVSLELPSALHKLCLSGGERIVFRTKGHSPVAVPQYLDSNLPGYITLVVSKRQPGLAPGAYVDMLGPVPAVHQRLEDIHDLAETLTFVVSDDRLFDLLPLPESWNLKHKEIHILSMPDALVSLDNPLGGSMYSKADNALVVKRASGIDELASWVSSAPPQGDVVVALGQKLQETFLSKVEGRQVHVIESSIPQACPFSRN